MDIVSRKAILRQLLAEARANKERAEQDADRVRLRVAEKVPVYADMSGAISRILIGASRRVLEDPAHGKEISAKAQREVLELKKRSEEARRGLHAGNACAEIPLSHLQGHRVCGRADSRILLLHQDRVGAADVRPGQCGRRNLRAL